ncbi:hypothetical protein [uncultured Roseibium sp.]|uniref:hypothetical protein n=1 Tax=uncultured Roseibium sp. TaxID=1936171 RepID=UPI0032171D1F
MKDDLFGPISFGNDARWVPLARKDDDPDILTLHMILDLVMVLRGTRPNRNLGMADEYIWAGEWDLAVGEIDAVIAQEAGALTELEAEVLRRAKIWVMSDEAG